MSGQSSAFPRRSLDRDDEAHAGAPFPPKGAVGNVIPWAVRSLRQAGIVRPGGEALRLLERATGLCRPHLIAFPETCLSSGQIEEFVSLVRRRAERVPAAYLTGRIAFLHWDFLVDERAMVPRPETEILVEVVAQSLQGCEEGWVVDAGTGSGVIGVSLALMLPGIRVLAVDISPGALEVARKNIALHGCEGRVFPVCGDLLAPLGAGVVAIVANLPYIPTDVLPTLEPEVAEHEPREALDGGADGLRVIARLAAGAADHLVDGGTVALEVGEGQAECVETLLKRHPRIGRTQVIPDYAGVGRVVMGFVAG